jgi:RNA polymerase sigma-70 factor (ECF subfamily)
VYRRALRMVGPDAAEDVAQQACLRAWLGMTTFEAKASFGTWLYRLAINSCLDHLRRERRFRPLPLEDAELLVDLDVAEHVEAAMEQREREQALAWALDQLPTEDRLLLHLRLADNLTYAEMAQVLAVRPGTAVQRAFELEQTALPADAAHAPDGFAERLGRVLPVRRAPRGDAGLAARRGGDVGKNDHPMLATLLATPRSPLSSKPPQRPQLRRPAPRRTRPGTTGLTMRSFSM